MTQWRYLPPILSANCVDSQTEHRGSTCRAGVLPVRDHPPAHVRARTGHRLHRPAVLVPGRPGRRVRIRGQRHPVGLPAAERGERARPGQPTNLDYAVGTRPLQPFQTAHAFQSYSHYVMPNGLVESFIDAIGNPDVRRGGTLAPTVKLTSPAPARSSTAATETTASAPMGTSPPTPSRTSRPIPTRGRSRDLGRAGRLTGSGRRRRRQTCRRRRRSGPVGQRHGRHRSGTASRTRQPTTGYRRGQISPEPRTTRWVGTTTVRGRDTSPSRRANSCSAARRPIC